MIYSSGRSSACCNLRKDIFFRRSAECLVATCTTLYSMYYVKHIFEGMKMWLIIANTLYNLKWSSCDILHVCLPPLGSDVFKVFNCVEVCSCSLKLNLICLINFCCSFDLAKIVMTIPLCRHDTRHTTPIQIVILK